MHSEIVDRLSEQASAFSAHSLSGKIMGSSPIEHLIAGQFPSHIPFNTSVYCVGEL